VPRILLDGDAEIIHDLRVASRRLQQALQTLPAPRHPKKLKRWRRELRRVRRALGPCRDADVIHGLVQAKAAQAHGATVQRAWHTFAQDLERRRGELLEPARRAVAASDLFAFIAAIQALLATVDDKCDPLEALSESVAAAMAEWHKALAAAHREGGAAEFHGLRIAGKRLRYRAELLADLGHAGLKSLVAALRQLQTALGDWHDRVVLLDRTGAFVAQGRLLTDRPDLGRVLLTEMEKERSRLDTAGAAILRDAAKVAEAWAQCKTTSAAGAAKEAKAD
jgi:CHAD domain-containing protein